MTQSRVLCLNETLPPAIEEPNVESEFAAAAFWLSLSACSSGFWQWELRRHRSTRRAG